MDGFELLWWMQGCCVVVVLLIPNPFDARVEFQVSGDG